ncbi:hypothetical protein NBRC110019_29520 [Neptunitalea chrysea]|uniref:Uncharacterized protein n=2 Tax=Neptunitalea chrysea TaxID=1647581 RepID=A0A9W6B6S0_9FLAO|nr:hypothetical protein NBRC110019_29520 [Neptunitalea chrysea]
MSSLASFGQIKVADKTTESWKTIGSVGAMGSANTILERSGDLIKLTFRDIRFTQLKVYEEVTFKDVDNAFENLYSVIMDALENMPEENITLKLPDGDLVLRFEKSFGKVNMNFVYFVSGVQEPAMSEYLTEKKVNKLFGKSTKKKKKKKK